MRKAAIGARRRRTSGHRVRLLATAQGRDYLPRVACEPRRWNGESDITGLEDIGGKMAFKRPMFAGNLNQWVEITTDRKVVSVSPTYFDAPAAVATGGEVKALDVGIDVGQPEDEVRGVRRGEVGAPRSSPTPGSSSPAGRTARRAPKATRKRWRSTSPTRSRRERRGRDPRHRRRRLGSQRLAGWSDRQGRCTGAVHRARAFRRDPAHRGHGRFQGHRRGEQRPGRPDPQDLRLRPRRRPLQRWFPSSWPR